MGAILLDLPVRELQASGHSLHPDGRLKLLYEPPNGTLMEMPLDESPLLLKPCEPPIEPPVELFERDKNGIAVYDGKMSTWLAITRKKIKPWRVPAGVRQMVEDGDLVVKDECVWTAIQLELRWDKYSDRRGLWKKVTAEEWARIKRSPTKDQREKAVRLKAHADRLEVAHGAGDIEEGERAIDAWYRTCGITTPWPGAYEYVYGVMTTVQLHSCDTRQTSRGLPGKMPRGTEPVPDGA